jgi:hypothetical protein
VLFCPLSSGEGRGEEAPYSIVPYGPPLTLFQGSGEPSDAKPDAYPGQGR